MFKVGDMVYVKADHANYIPGGHGRIINIDTSDDVEDGDAPLFISVAYDEPEKYAKVAFWTYEALLTKDGE